MEFQSYLRALRKRWRLVAGSILLFLIAAGIWTALTPNSYQSTVSFFVSTSDTSDSNQLAQGGTFTQQRVKSYTELVTTPEVLTPVANQLHLKGGSNAISPLVSAKSTTDTVIIDVAVTESDAKQATQIAKEIGNTFPQAVMRLERVNDSRPSPVKVTVVQNATSPATKVGPNLPVNLALAGFLGLMLGICLALLRERMDTKIRSREDLELVDEELPLLGAIPFDNEAPKKPLVIDAAAGTHRAEAFRTLRTNLWFVDAAEHPRVIVVTSSLPGEGKSTTTANLAFAIANSGSSVCLIEGDLRRPRLLSYLGMEGGVGLTDVLIGKANIRDVVQRFGDMRLMVLGSGQTPPNPSELLGSQSMRELLDDLRTRFDYVVIDAPPLLPVTDGAVLAAMADGAVVVAGSGLVRREQLNDALGHLDAVKARILGLILNRAPRSGPGRYYDYSYESVDSQGGGATAASQRSRRRKEKA